MARKQKRQIPETNANVTLGAVLSLNSIRRPGGLEEAISWISHHISPTEFETTIRGLSASPGILALLLASSSELHQATIRFLEDSQFPTTIESYCDSLQGTMSFALHKFWSLVQPPVGVEPGEYQFRIRAISAAHTLLSKEMDSAFEFEHATGLSSHGQKKRKRLQMQAHVTTSPVARNAFECFDEEPPQNLDEKRDLVKRLLDHQEASLKYFLQNVFTQPTTLLHVKTDVLRIVDAPQTIDLPTASYTSTRPAHKNKELPVAEPDFAEDSNSFSRISPAKAKHVFEAPDGWGNWHLFLAGRAIKHLRTFRKTDQGIFYIVEKKIKDLSHGFFSSSNQKFLVGGPADVQIFEAKLSRDLRLVYRIDLQTDDQLKVDRQVILIYGIYTHAQLDHRLWGQVAHFSPRNGAEYRRRCEYRAQPLVHGANTNHVTVPMEWPHEDYPVSARTPPTDFNEEDFLELHRICALEKFVPITKALLQTILADVDAMHQFAVSPSEKRIINHEGSCFVIGRSGTGKTTTMVFKMLGIELANRRTHFADRPRQMFLTQSHVLARHVAGYYTQLLRAAEFQHVTHQMLPAEDLLDFDEDNDERGDLPEKFSDLEDKHFPLFATFDQIRRMLENDLGVAFSRREAIRQRKREDVRTKTSGALNVDFLSLVEDVFLDRSGSESISIPKHNFVSFSAFLTKYWSHFDQRLTKGLDPALIFSEIMGAIRGHEDTIALETGYLDKQSYLSLSHRTHSSLSRHRERVYGIFESYLRMKQERGMLDSPDRTHNILRAFRTRIPGKVDFIYVDEVQDLLIIDTKLLRDLCSNPHGFFWGGDTAQTISVGSSFRFEDLKAFMYREEELHPHVEAQLRKPIQPTSFQLLVNYRSHGGIVDCAASLIELLSSMFPYSIDKLTKESALVTGPKPRIFLNNVVHFEEFLNPVGESRLDFGAHQVIIVRDDVARLRLREVLGDSGLVLTLLESKGLEFDDVLLHNFFASSPASINQWRIVNSDDFRDLDKHRTLESELKRLYVAVTRARHHCWIWESNTSQHPMIAYWIAHGLVRLHAPDDPMPTLATHSTPEQWDDLGRSLFGRKLYPQAASCFEKAGRPLEQDICGAYELHKQARESLTYHPNSFKTAAAEFRRCAGSSSQDLMAVRLHKKAGECFVEARDLLSAAESYTSALDFNMAARLYRKAGMFDKAVALVKPISGQPSQVDKKICDEIIQVAKFEYARNSNLKQMAIVFEGKIDEQLRFTELYGFQEAQISLHIDVGDFRAAGELHEKLGDFESAAKCFLQSKETQVRQRAIASVLESLNQVAFGAKFAQESIRTLRTLRLLDNVAEGDFIERDKIMVRVFRAMSIGDRAGLEALALRNRGDDFIYTLCQNQAVLCPGFSIETLGLQELLREVEFEFHYFRSLRGMIALPKNLCHQSNTALLLGIRSATGPGWEHLVDYFTVDKDSYLGRACEQDSIFSGSAKHQGITIALSAHQLDGLARKTIEAEIKRSLLGLHDKLKGMPVLQPCMNAAIYGSCDRYSCARDHAAIALPDYPSLMIRLLLQIICLLNLLWSLSGARRWREIHGIWIRKLFEAFQPLTHRLGCASLPHGVPSGQVRIVQKWINDMVFDAVPYGPRERFFLSDCILLSWMVGTMYDFGVPHYFGRAGIIHRRPDLVREGEVSIVEDLLAAIARGHPDEERLKRGILAIKHIMDKELPVDLLFVVSYLEQLSLEILITVMQNNKWSLNDLLLPRSWVLRLIRGPERTACRNPPVSLLFGSIGILMRKIILWNGAGPFLLSGKVFTLASLPRNLLLARICRLLVITGFKGSFRVQGNILKTIRESLNVGDIKHNFLYAKYASANNWQDLVNALLESGSPRDHDHLVHLRGLPRGHFKPMKNARLITFQNLKDIDDALFVQENPLMSRRSTAPEAETPSAPGTQPHALAPAPMDMVTGTQAVDADTSVMPSLEVIDGETGEQKDDVDEGPLVNFDSNQTMELPPRPEEENAARRIQLCYRRSLHRRKSSRDATLAKNYAACMADIPNILNHLSCNHRRYIAVTRMAVPPALCVLDRLLVGAAERKNGFLKKLRDVRHEDLERAHERVDSIMELIKKTECLRREVGPGGVAFRSGHMSVLRAAVREVIDFAAEAKTQVGPYDTAIDADIAIIGGIIPKPHVPEQEEKPRLNVEEDFWY